MSPLLAMLWTSAVLTTAAAKDFTEELDVFPRLFHLDNYKRCLSQQDGLYCLGTFHLTADGPNEVYESLKEYSSDSLHFNRTLIHRGYCVSSRCPTYEHNATLRFERCVEQRARPLALKATLQNLKYCRTRQQAETATDTTELPYRLFVAVVGVLLLLNTVGTAHDIFKEEKHKSNILASWSLKGNWRRLTTSYDDNDPSRSSLAPIQGIRVFLLFLVIISHSIEMTYKVHMNNPNFLERVQRNPLSIMFKNGSSIVQASVVISNFLFAYILLGNPLKKKISLSILPMCILYRIVRISPVYLLIVGFSATWWKLTGDGPLWHELVNAESEICRRKFWSHAFYVQNFVEPEKQCMLHTWFLAVDMQLYIVAGFLTLVLMNNRRRALYVIASLFIASCLMNVGLAYIYEWKSLMYLLSVENLRTTFEGVPSVWYYYISPWGSLPACLLGLFVAHLHLYVKEQGYKITKTKWLVQLYNAAVPLNVAWVLTGCFMTSQTTRASVAAYIGLERPIFSAICALILYGVVDNVDNWFRRWMSWRGWSVPARLSLCVLVLHRTINLQLVAARTAYKASVLSILLDTLATSFASYLLALPLTLLVEIPVQRTFVALFLKQR